MEIHSHALVEDGAVLGDGVSVGPFAWIASGARVGEGSVIGPHAVVHGGARIGARCTVHAGAVIADLPQDLSFDPDFESVVEIGDGCTIREGATINRGSHKGDGVTRIGAGCFLMSLAHVGHDCTLGDGVVMATSAALGGHVTVGAGAFLGGGANAHQWVRIGRLAMVGGLAGLSSDMPPFCMSKSVELNALCGINMIGLKRAGMPEAERAELRRAYRVLFREGLSRREAISRVEESGSCDAVRELVEFVRSSKRGVAGQG